MASNLVDLYVSDPGGNVIYRIDPITGDRTILADNVSAGAGPALDQPTHLSFNLSGALLALNGPAGVANLLEPDGVALKALIQKAR